MTSWLSAAALLLTETAQGQIVSSLDASEGNGGIVSSVEAGGDTTGILSDWNDVLKKFSEMTEESEQQLTEKIDSTERATTQGTVKIRYKDRDLLLPSYVAEDGIDYYMLTEEGITVYMAMLAPVFYQETTDDIVRWVRYYAYRSRRNTARMFDRYAKWEEYIKETFTKDGVPQEIGVLCMIESGCTPDAVSRVGATGMWQIMDYTAKDWGLIVTDIVDQRRDPYISTRTASKILASSHVMTPDWTLCIAGYNCGMGRVQSIIGRCGTTLWPDLKPDFPAETQQYIPSLLAICYVWNYRKQLGF